MMLKAKERAKDKPKFKGTVRDSKVVARVWAKAAVHHINTDQLKHTHDRH